MIENSVKNKTYTNAGNSEVARHVKTSGIDTEVLEILDVGCGAGDNARYFKEHGHVVDGITLSEDEAKIARSFCREVYIHNLESGLPGVLKEKKYDYVVCSHVLEHICFPETLLSGIRECLKPNGKLIIALPNLLFIRNRWKLLLGHFNYTDSGIMDNTHFRWYTFNTSADLMRKNHFIVTEHYSRGFMPLGPVRRLFPNVTKKLDSYLCRVWPGLFGHQLVLVSKTDAS